MNRLINRAMMKPLELLAGERYPDVEAVRQEAVDDGGSNAEVFIAVDFEKSIWRHHLLHFDGLKRAIQNLRGE